MEAQKKSFIKVDELMPKISVEQVCAYYGVELPEIRHTASEIRSKCFLLCGRDGETSDRALSIQADHPAKQWKCFHRGCGKGGNLVSICDLLRPGDNMAGRPRGQRFKDIAADLLAIAAGRTNGSVASPAAPVPAGPHPLGALSNERRLVENVPLSCSDNERARALVNLDEKFVTDIEKMPPKASAFFRRRPWLTPEVCRAWRMGYLPRDAGGDKQGGSMRGRIVFAYLSDQGELLTWFGLDPDFDEKHRKWFSSAQSEPEPQCYRFVKGFDRNLELFGQYQLEKSGPWSAAGLGLFVVQEPTDVIRLSALGVPAIGVGNDSLSDEQAEKAARLAREAGEVLTVMFECTEEGAVTAKETLGKLARVCPVRLAWAPELDAGVFAGRKPESLAPEEWDAIGRRLRRSSAWTVVDGTPGI